MKAPRALGLVGPLALVGCAWILAHDPPAVSTMTRDCTGLDEGRCGSTCCDEDHGWSCNPFAAPPRCEFEGTADPCVGVLGCGNGPVMQRLHDAGADR